MKYLLLLISSALMLSCGLSTPKEQQATIDTPNKNHIAIYDFHTDHRCETCIAIEKTTKETINTNFKTQLDDKTITFTLINADSEENQTISEEYGAFGTTLAITIIKESKKEIIDITNWAFEAINGEDFNSELTKKLNTALAKL
jgi:hypothetical protein